MEMIGARLNRAQGMRGMRAQHSQPRSVSANFGEYLQEQVSEVNRLQTEADGAVGEMLSGKKRNLHEMMIALDKADISLRLLGKIRSKALEAYQEVSRMHV